MTTTGIPATAPITFVPPALWSRVLKRPIGAISLAFLSLVAVIAVIGPFIAPQDPNHKNLRSLAEVPSSAHLMGTDSSGRDVLSRILSATQTSIGAALLAVFVAALIGISAGLIAGYYQGMFNRLSSWVIELIMALPGIVILLAGTALIGPSVWISMIIVGVLLAPAYYRLVYDSVSAVRTELYIDAARVSGVSDARIIGRHVLSVVRAPIVIQTANVASIALAVQSGLEFLGIGDVNVPTWGGMLTDGFRNIYSVPILTLWPALAIAITCLALTLLANVLRDELERSSTTQAQQRRAGSRDKLPVITRREDALDLTAVIEHRDPMDDVAGEPVLRVRDLRVGYNRPDGSTLEVVRGISFDVRKGEVHGLVGESGSGKTQTAFATLGLLPPNGRVTSGSIRYEGVDLVGSSDRAYAAIRGRRIGYIPQEPMSNLDPCFTIGSHLVEPLRRVRGVSKKLATERSLELLERVGIRDPQRCFAAFPHEISGGMAQRVLIAGAVSTDPDLIIADEPTTALDVTVQADVLDLLRELQSERGLSLLLVTHNFGVVADLCDRVTVMQSGRFVEQGHVRAIFNDPQHPYTVSLLEAILDEEDARGPLVTERILS